MRMTGYRPIPSKDPEEQRLRELWHSAPHGPAREEIGRQLSAHLWNRIEAVVAADRIRHPKKLRNLPVPTTGPSGGRYLP